jgi:hypothetical protein
MPLLLVNDFAVQFVPCYAVLVSAKDERALHDLPDAKNESHLQSDICAKRECHCIVYVRQFHIFVQVEQQLATLNHQ